MPLCGFNSLYSLIWQYPSQFPNIVNILANSHFSTFFRKSTMKKFDKRLCAFSGYNMLKPSGKRLYYRGALEAFICQYLSEPLSLIYINSMKVLVAQLKSPTLCNPMDCM